MERNNIIVLIVIIVLLAISAVLINGIIFTDNGLVGDNSNLNSTNSLIKWNNNLDDALKQSQKENKNIFIYFGAEWCGYCKSLEKDTFTNPQLAKKLNNEYICVKVDTDENPDLASKYNVKGLPTLMILDSEGNPIKTIPGFATPEELLTKL